MAFILARSPFAAAFAGRTRFRDARRGTVEVTTRVLGELKVPSGRIVASDPFTTAFEEPGPPYTVTAPTGVFPVEVAVARYPDNGDERVACARLRFATDAPAVTWKAAQLGGRDYSGDDDLDGYGVDAGTGCFFDMEAAAPVDEAEAQRWLDAMQQRQVDTWSWHVADHGKANVVMFSSGIGDGCYSSYWGHDASGRLVELVTDFEILVGPLEEKFELPLPLPRGRVQHPLLTRQEVKMRVPWLSRSSVVISGKGSASVELSDGSPVELDRRGHTLTRRYTWDPPAPGVRLVVAVMVGQKPLDVIS